MIRIIPLLLIICFVPHTEATTLTQASQWLKSSLGSFAANKRDNWSYTVFRELGTGKEKLTQVERYHADKPKGKRWQLLKEYGKTPSDNRRAEYLDLKQKQAKQNGQTSQPQQSLLAMIAMDSLSIVTQDQQTISLSFTPILPNMPPQALSKLTGFIVIDKAKRYVRKMSIRNLDELAVAPDTKLSYFAMKFDFVLLNKVMLPNSISIDFKGKMGLDRDIGQHSYEQYSRYKYTNKTVNP